MKVLIAAHAVFLALIVSLQAYGQVVTMEQAGLQTAIKASQDGGQADVNLSIIPATVTLAGGRREQGWFTVVTDPRQKLYWWRFQAGTFQTGNSAPVVDFAGSCSVYAAPQKLVVFCATSRHLLVASSTRAYAADTALPGLVSSEFDQRATRLDTGFDYFDWAFNLWTTLGSGFFLEPGRANAINRVTVRSISRSPDRWDVVVGGANNASARLTFSPEFSLRESVRLP